jgi:hypothetical protein
MSITRRFVVAERSASSLSNLPDHESSVAQQRASIECASERIRRIWTTEGRKKRANRAEKTNVDKKWCEKFQQLIRTRLQFRSCGVRLLFLPHLEAQTALVHGRISIFQLDGLSIEVGQRSENSQKAIPVSEEWSHRGEIEKEQRERDFMLQRISYTLAGVVCYGCTDVASTGSATAAAAEWMHRDRESVGRAEQQ